MPQLKSSGMAAIAAVAVFAQTISSGLAGVTFVGTGLDATTSTHLAASATFANDGHGDLVVTLRDTATDPAESPTSMLTAILFTLHGIGTLTPSAISSGPVVQWNSTTHSWVTLANPDIGGNWRYQGTLGPGSAPNGAKSGISSTGLNLFQSSGPGGGGNFPGTPEVLGSPPWALVNVNFDQNSQSLKSNDPFITGSVTFTLSGLGAIDPSALNVTDVLFQYGTSQSAPNFIGTPSPVPEPSTIIAGILLILPVTASTLRALRNVGNR